MTAIKAPRISGTGMTEPVSAARDWVAGHGADFQRLVDSLRGDVAINAAGLAAPASGDAAGLRGANAVWPAVMSLACREAAVPRLVHVSSAAVQGRRDPLDESTEHEPFSRYTRSKAEGEGALLRLGEAGRGVRQLVVYRPTSVQGAGRRTTATLVRLSRLRHLPVTDGGRQQLPLILVTDVARACLLLAGTPRPPQIALHPWDGMTTAQLLEWLAPGHRGSTCRRPWSAPSSVAYEPAGGSGRGRALSGSLTSSTSGRSRIDAHALRDRGYASTTGDRGLATPRPQRSWSPFHAGGFMPLLTAAALESLLACPVCRGQLLSRDGRYFCSRRDCRHSKSPFVQVGDVPVLVDFERSILQEVDVVRRGAGSVIPRHRPRLVDTASRVLMPNPVARRNARRLRELLSDQTPAPVVLVVGGGVVGNGLDELYSDSSLGLIALDLYASPLVQVVADGHQIPLADQSVDAVVIQAVLQSTLEPGVVVDEIHRVLRPDGLVYAETGFMQQVCEGPYDFYRFTERGQRYLFRGSERWTPGWSRGRAHRSSGRWTTSPAVCSGHGGPGGSSARCRPGCVTWIGSSRTPTAWTMHRASTSSQSDHEVPVEDIVNGYRGALRPSAGSV